MGFSSPQPKQAWSNLTAGNVDSATRAFEGGKDEDKMREAVRLAVRRCSTAWTGKKPLVEVMVLRVDA